MGLLSGKHGLVIGNLIKVVTVYLLDHKIYDTVNKGSLCKEVCTRRLRSQCKVDKSLCST